MITKLTNHRNIFIGIILFLLIPALPACVKKKPPQAPITLTGVVYHIDSRGGDLELTISSDGKLLKYYRYAPVNKETVNQVKDYNNSGEAGMVTIFVQEMDGEMQLQWIKIKEKTYFF
jgi:hypothetical protein